METLHYNFSRLSMLFDIGIYKYHKSGEFYDYNPQYNETPLKSSESLRLFLMEKAENEEVPVIWQDAYKVFWVCMHREETFYFLGPATIETLSFVERHRYYRGYKLEETKRPLRKYFLAELLQLVEVIAEDVLEKQFSDESLVQVNQLVQIQDESLQEEQIIFNMKQEDEDAYHHSYREEQFLLTCVREGREEEALAFSKNMDRELGKMSKQEKNHWNNAAVAAITLCTRAAIEGGISPGTAYQLSDFYIQKVDQATDILQKLDYRNKAIADMVRRVRDRGSQERESDYVEQCKDYISKNYREKIYLADMAATSGLSPSYLSRFFFKETGVHLQDYINEFRVERAANMLRFSEESLLYISEYLCFQSQSYFGKIFKKYKNITPKEYREFYKTRVFMTDRHEKIKRKSELENPGTLCYNQIRNKQRHS